MDTQTKQRERNELIDTVKIRHLAESNGLSMAELARRIGINRQKLHARMHQGTPITANELLQIADNLGVSADDLRKTS